LSTWCKNYGNCQVTDINLLACLFMNHSTVYSLWPVKALVSDQNCTHYTEDFRWTIWPFLFHFSQRTHVQSFFNRITHICIHRQCTDDDIKSHSIKRFYSVILNFDVSMYYRKWWIYDTIEEFNVDSKAECDQLNLAHVARNKKV